MAWKSERGRQPVSGGGARSRIRAFRHDDIRAELERRLTALGHGLEFVATSRDCPDSLLVRRLRRALRAERRAARAGTIGYDLLRHLALARIDGANKRRGRTGEGGRRR